MKKNNKGFTLIEVIAVVALLGIISVIAVPKIYELVTNSRKEVYIQDAKKLIAKVQYEMNAGNQKIEKPDIDECIIISLSYVSDRDFKTAPNNGQYLSDSSFVVVKNVRGKYYYSAMMIEKVKGDSYMGIELSSENELANKSAIKHVRAFSKDEVLVISNQSIKNQNGALLDMADYINNNIQASDTEKPLWSTESEDIIAYYHNGVATAIEDSINAVAPKINAKFGNNGGSLQTSLSVSATDNDDSISDLKLCLKVTHNENDTYPNPQSSDDYSKYCFSYGNDVSHVIDVDLSQEKYDKFTHNDMSAYFYLAVSDPQGNVAHKKLLYNIRSNEPPMITRFKVVKQDADKFALPKAKVSIMVIDDIDNVDDLKVCFIQDNLYANGGLDNSGDCKKYVNFKSVFGDDLTGFYEFFENVNNEWKKITSPDGSSHNLKIKIKDSYGAISSSEASYTIYKNNPPVIKTDGVAQGIPVMINGRNAGNSLTAKLEMNITDDISSPENINIKIGDVKMTYADYLNSDKLYTFSGGLDGRDREVIVTVNDEHKATSTTTFKLTNVYHGTEPSISIKSISSFTNPCNGASSCFNIENGGNLKVNYELELSDDVTSTNDLLVCVSDNAQDCSSNANSSNNFKKYSDLAKTYTFKKYSNTYDYPPTASATKKLYAAVKDEDGLYTIVDNPAEYNIYHNFAPIITGDYSVATTDLTGESETISFDFSNMVVEDDFSNYKAKFCYKYTSDTKEKCTEYNSYLALKNSLKDGYTIDYSKGSLVFYFLFEDNYGAKTKSTVTNKDKPVNSPPTITSFEIDSTESRYNSNKIIVRFKVADAGDEYKICLTEDSENCNNYIGNGSGWYSGDLENGFPIEYSLNIDGEKYFDWDENYDMDRVKRTINLFVMDKHNNIVSDSATYNLYKLCSQRSSMVVDFTSNEFSPVNAFDNPITPSKCLGQCYRNYVTTSNENNVNYMNGSNNYFGQFTHEVRYTDTLVNKTCTINEREDLYCNYAECFNVADNSKDPTYIDLNLQNENEVWSYSTVKIANNVISEDNPLCENPPGDPLFNMNDARCTNEDYCKEKVESVCRDSCTVEREEAYSNYIIERNEALDNYIKLLRLEYTSYMEYCNCLQCEEVLKCYDSGETTFRFSLDGINGLGNGGKIDIPSLPCATISDELTRKCVKRREDGKACSKCATLIQTDASVDCNTWTVDSIDSFLELKRREFIENYPAFEFDCGDTGEAQKNCVTRETAACQNYLSTFCNNSGSVAKYEVSCDSPDKTDGPFLCSELGYSNGYCLGDIDECDSSDKGCNKKCYQEVACDSSENLIHSTILCHGYFKSYKPVRSGTTITLKETGLRVCPDFYRLYPEMFKYDASSNKPFIVFNSLEQGGANNG